MIRFIIDRDNGVFEITTQGDIMHICAEIGAAVGDMYTQLSHHNPTMAGLFRSCMEVSFTPGSPVWNCRPVFGAGSIYAEFPGKDERS